MKTRANYVGMLKLALPVLGILAVVGLGIYLSATVNDSKTAGKTNIRWVVDPHPIRGTTIALFEKSNPDIHVVNDTDAGAQRLLTQLAGNVPPDVMALYSPGSLRKFAENDLLLNLRPYVKKYKIPVDDLRPQLRPYIYYKDQIVAIPENCAPMSVFYNKKLFREAGVPFPKPNWTWNDCLDVAKKLTKYKTVNGRQVAVQKGLYTLEFPHMFVWMYGGRMFSEDGKTCLIDQERAMKGIRFWSDLRMKYKVIPSASEAQSMAPTGGYGGDQLLFSQGKVAMIITGRYMISQYRIQKGLDWDVANFPKGPYPCNPFVSKCYAIPKSCKHKDAAIRFICHLMDRKNEDLVAGFGDGLPARQDPQITRDFLYNPQYPNEKNNQVFLDDVKSSRVPDISPYISETDFSSITSEEFGKIWLGQQNADKACRMVAKRVNEIIRRNLLNPNFMR